MNSTPSCHSTAMVLASSALAIVVMAFAARM
jgi:hypothetical protein